ncbi:acetolactate decarboxylase [Komagataeibacter rhaeticus]|nr:acetolactate decarboxylase [Komagataeibacter rhaeticus]
MLEVVARQPTMQLGAATGTMLGFRTPGYMQGVNVAGYHLHFLTEDGRRGGHVTDYGVLRGRLEVGVISDVEIQLPRTEQFARANLSPKTFMRPFAWPRAAEGLPFPPDQPPARPPAAAPTVQDT